jgi:hypothetical protein
MWFSKSTNPLQGVPKRLNSACILSAFMLFTCLPPVWADPAAAALPPPRPASNFGKIPLSFEPNRGQSDPHVQFLSRGSGYSLFLTAQEVVLSLQQQKQDAMVDTLRMALAGADAKVNFAGLDRQPGIVNYFMGNDPAKWHANIPTYGKVKATGIYPGIDLVFYGNQRQLEYDFVVAPGADPTGISWEITGARLSIDADGNLQLAAADGPAAFKKPVMYQLDGQRKVSVDGRYQVAGNRVRFVVGSYDHARPLIIDPVLVYATYLGGASENQDATGGNTQIGNFTGFYPSGISNPTQALAIDSAGDVYVTGYTNATNFPLQNPVQGSAAGIVADYRATAAFVTKFNPQGTGVIYSTYLGGLTDDTTYGTSIAVDGSGNAYVAGYTDEPTFPVTSGAFQTICGANWTGSAPNFTRTNGCNPEYQVSGFVTKLNPTGSNLVYSTFLGGQVGDQIYAIAVDGSGRAYVAGNSGDYCDPTTQPAYACFPTTAGAVLPGTASRVYVPSYGSDALFTQMAFVSVFDSAGANLLYSTYIGDNTALISSGAVAPSTWGGTNASALTIDSAGDFFLAGITRAPNLPITSNAFQGAPTGLPGSGSQGFVAKFSPITDSGSTLDYLTYFGGPDAGEGSAPSGLAANSEGEVYITGTNYDQNFPTTAGAYQTSCGITSDTQCGTAFVSKLNASGGALVWSTMLGNKLNGAGQTVADVGAIALDSAGDVYVTGQTTGANNDFPLVNPIQTGVDEQPFISEFDPTGSKLLFSTLLGSGSTSGTETPAGLAVDGSGNIYLAGNTNSKAIPTTPGAFQTALAGTGDGYVAKISALLASTTSLTVSPNPANVGQLVTLTAQVTGQSGSPTPTGSITFNLAGAEFATGTLDGTGKATTTTSTLAANTYSFTAVYSGDGTYSGSTSSPAPLTVNSGTQSITFAALPNVTYGVAPITLTAKASSGLPVSYAVTGPASLSGSVLTITGVGPVSVTASQSGNGEYSAATPVIQGFQVTQASQTITFGAIATQTVGGSVTLSATASSGLTVSFSSLTTSVCTVSGTTANLLASGSCTIAAMQGGNTDYSAASTVNQSFTVSQSSSGPGFTITPEPGSETIKRGDVAAFLLVVQSVNGFKGNVTLSCSGGPVGSKCADLPQTISVNGKALAISGILFPKSTVPGVYTLTFTGKSGSLTNSATAKFTVQ